MKRTSGPGRAMGEGYKQLLGLGMTFAGGIILFMLVGLLVDRWLGVLPLFTVIGTLAGAVLGFINVYTKIAAVTAADKATDQRRREQTAKDERVSEQFDAEEADEDGDDPDGTAANEWL